MTVTGQGTTFNLPNYVGELFSLTPTDTPFLSAIGGLTGGEATDRYIFPWQTYDLRTAAVNTALEGAAAPTAQARVRSNVSNVVEVHQSTVEISYTKLAAVGQYAAVGATNPQVAGVSGSNPVGSELDWQVAQELKSIARDIEYSFVRGAKQDPANNSSARRTGGILEAITTNVVDASGATLTEDDLLDLMQDVWEQGGIQEEGTATLMTNAWQKRKLTKIFIKDLNFRQTSRNVGGVDVDTIETDFGTLNIMLNRHMPTDTVAVLSLEQCAPVFLNIPGKGFLFVEPLAKVGAAERVQIYGEVGLKFGNQRTHGKIINLNTNPAS